MCDITGEIVRLKASSRLDDEVALLKAYKRKAHSTASRPAHGSSVVRRGLRGGRPRHGECEQREAEDGEGRNSESYSTPSSQSLS